MEDTSRLSSIVRDGRIPGIHFASSDFPAPGGPIIKNDVFRRPQSLRLSSLHSDREYLQNQEFLFLLYYIHLFDFPGIVPF